MWSFGRGLHHFPFNLGCSIKTLVWWWVRRENKYRKVSFYCNHVFTALPVSCVKKKKYCMQQAWLLCIKIESIFKSCGCRAANELWTWNGSPLLAQRLSCITTPPHRVNSEGATIPHSRLSNLAVVSYHQCPHSTVKLLPDWLPRYPSLEERSEPELSQVPHSQS